MPRGRALTPGASPAHHFGSEVRRAREAVGMTQSELAELVPCDTATVSRIENGVTFPPDGAFARACSTAFGNEWFLRFWKDSQTWGAAVFPQSLREFAAYEAEAVTLWLCEHSVLPGLLQVEPYALAVLERHPDTDSEQAAERAAARIARQAVLERDRPPRVWVLIDESALYREVAAPKVMSDQMVRLVELGRRPNITVQLIPRKGAHVGLSGAFAIAETAETTVAYIDHQADAMTTDSPATVALLCSRFDSLRTEAFRGSESLALIEEAADRWASNGSSS
jgi:transcriptional regulator with XRE-family HTH domain